MADSNAPTECRISINNNALYTNNRYVTLELYGTDADPMQVWISNDGENGTVLDFAYGKTISITDANYTVGVALDDTNSTTTTNSDNILRIENWPLSSVNGTKTVYAVFRDSYGNKTSVNGLNTITITYDLNGGSGTLPAPDTTVRNLGIYTPSLLPTAVNQSFTGWILSPSQTIPNYAPNSLVSFDQDVTLYANFKTVKVGDYVYYPIDLTKTPYSAPNATTGVGTQTFNLTTLFSSSPALFQVLASSTSSIILCPSSTSQTFNLSLLEEKGYYYGKNAVTSICSLYATNYSNSVTAVTEAQMVANKTTNGLNSFFGNYFWILEGWQQVGADGRGYTSNSNGRNQVHFCNLDGGNSGGTHTYPVAPAITLKTSVKFLGTGTSSSPYTLYLP